MKARRASIASAAGALMVAAVVAGPTSAETMLAVGPRLTLLDKGMSLAVPVRYECPRQAVADQSSWLEVAVTQAVPGNRHGRVPISSYSILEAKCDDRAHSATMRLYLDHWELPFRSGIALVTWSLDYTDASGNRQQVFLSQELRLSPSLDIGGGGSS